MSRAGNRVTPAPEPASDGPGGGGGSPLASWSARGVRSVGRIRPSRTVAAPVADGRWGVARLVAEREAQRRAAEAPAVHREPARAEPVRDEPIRDGGTEAGSTVRAPETRTAVPDADPTAVSAADPTAAAADPTAVRAGPGLAVPAPAPRADEPPGPPAPRDPEPVGPPAPRAPLVPRPPAPPRPLPAPRRPFVPNASDARLPRPRVEPDPALIGFARHTRGRLGSRLFTLFFVLVFGLIAVQTLASIL